jgi:hypothetical protein
MAKVTVQERSTVHAEQWALTPIPIPRLTERFRSFEQLGKTTGRFGYRQWCYGEEFLGVCRGDIIKIDLRVPPKGIRGEIVWVEIIGNNIETMGALEAWSRSRLEVWTDSATCAQGSTAECLPRKVLGKLQLDPSQRQFFMHGYRNNGDVEGRQRLDEVMKPRPAGTKTERPAAPSILSWLLAQPTHGRLLDLTSKLKQRGLCSDSRRKGR